MAQSLNCFLALNLGGDDGLARVGDPCNLCWQKEPSHSRQRISMLLALLVHGLLFLVVIPTAGRQLTVSQPLILTRLAPPSQRVARLTADPPEVLGSSTPLSEGPKLIPMPILEIPRPVLRHDSLEAPEILQREWPASELSLGEVSGPPPAGPPGQRTEGVGRQSGIGPADFDPVYRPGVGGVSPPELLVGTLPAYTDSAIKARIQGTVLLQVVVRRDGSVDSIQVLRGLGHGLDEKAVEEIATRWKFRPGRRNGQPVDVRAVIEVSFSLR